MIPDERAQLGKITVGNAKVQWPHLFEWIGDLTRIFPNQINTLVGNICSECLTRRAWDMSSHLAKL